MQLVLKEQPMLFVLYPMCKAFSRWQSFNAHKRSKKLVEQEWKKAMVHLNFACELMKVQLRARRYFLYEHPLAASSWSQLCAQEVMRHPDVTWVLGDQCQYGQQGGGEDLVKKPTKWMSNSPELLKALEQHCAGRG